MEAALISSLGRTILRKSIITIGRASDNELVINDPKVSSHHAEIHLTQHSYSIVDLGSTNGTFVNEARLTKAVPYLLSPGDICRLGDFTFTYQEYPSSQGDDAKSAPYIPRPRGGDLHYDRASSEDYPVPLWRDSTGALSPIPESESADIDSTSISEQQHESSPVPQSKHSDDYRPLPTMASQKRPPNSSAAPTPPRASEYLQFTAFHPRIVPVETWNVILVYAYIQSAFEDVRADAYKFREQLGSESFKVDSWASHPLARGDQITIVPTVQGLTFSPDRITFNWEKDWHRSIFSFNADQRWAGTVRSGEITVFNGPLIIATFKISLRFGEHRHRPNSSQEEVSAKYYRKIFTSYSHNDTSIVLAIRKAYEAIGDHSFLDTENLRSGQNWNAALLRMIDNADIFQLFWSKYSAQSAYVYQEWQYALEHYKYDGFIRPVYWEKPMKPPPDQLSHLHFSYYELPQRAIGSKKKSLASRLSSIFVRKE